MINDSSQPLSDPSKAATIRAQEIFQEWSYEFDFHRFEMARFVDFVEKKRCCKIVLTPWKLPPCISGVWMTAGCYEFIFFEKEAHLLHQLHFQIHELCHILCGHETWRLDVDSKATHKELMTEIHLALLQIKADTENYLNQIRLRFPSPSTVEKEVELLSEFIMAAATSDQANYSKPITTSLGLATLHQEMGWL